MNSMAIYLFLGSAIITLAVALLAYNAAGVEWRVKPARPFMWGLAILAVGFVSQIYLSHLVADSRGFLLASAGGVPAAALEIIKSGMIANETSVKLLEFFTIPIGVSLIATALFVKADLQFAGKMISYQMALEQIDQTESELQVLDDDCKGRVLDGERGQEIIDCFEDLKRRRLQLLFARRALHEEFKIMIDARVVRAPR